MNNTSEPNPDEDINMQLRTLKLSSLCSNDWLPVNKLNLAESENCCSVKFPSTECSLASDLYTMLLTGLLCASPIGKSSFSSSSGGKRSKQPKTIHSTMSIKHETIHP